MRGGLVWLHFSQFHASFTGAMQTKDHLAGFGFRFSFSSDSSSLVGFNVRLQVALGTSLSPSVSVCVFVSSGTRFASPCGRVNQLVAQGVRSLWTRDSGLVWPGLARLSLSLYVILVHRSVHMLRDSSPSPLRMRARPNVIIISTIEFPVYLACLPPLSSLHLLRLDFGFGTDVAQNVTNVHLIAQLNNFISAPRSPQAPLTPRS